MALSELDTELTLHDGPAPGEHRGRLGDGWRIGNGVNGGVLMALAATALRRELGGDGGHDDPLAVSAYFVSPAAPGPVLLRTETIRQGRSVSTGQASLLQPHAEGEHVERMRALATFGDLDRSAVATRSAAMPDLPLPERCLSAADAPPVFLQHASLLERVELRLDPSTAGWAMGKPSGRGVLRGWLRLRDGRDPDPVMLLFALDAMPPVAFDLGHLGWAPTLELTAHVRANPAPGWLAIELSTANLAGGLMEEDAQVWDSTGRLVAQSRQLCGVRMPGERP